MTDEQEKSPNKENSEEAVAPKQNKRSTEDIDVEGALAALASLHDLSRDETAESQEESSPNVEEFQRLEQAEEDSAADSGIVAAESPSPYETIFPRPPVSVLHRGQLASVVPALLLIGIGAYLTFVLTTSNTAIEPSIIAAIFIAGLGLMLLAQWLSSARWAMGNFFFASFLLLGGGTLVYLLLPTTLNLAQAWPLLITALGTSLVLTDLFVPSGRRLWFLGLILAVASLAALSISLNLIPSNIAQIFGLIWPVPIVLLLLILLLPLFRR